MCRVTRPSSIRAVEIAPASIPGFHPSDSAWTLALNIDRSEVPPVVIQHPSHDNIFVVVRLGRTAWPSSVFVYIPFRFLAAEFQLTSIALEPGLGLGSILAKSVPPI